MFYTFFFLNCEYNFFNIYLKFQEGEEKKDILTMIYGGKKAKKSE